MEALKFKKDYLFLRKSRDGKPKSKVTLLLRKGYS